MQLASQNYKICMRQEEGRCCIQYSIIAYDMGAANSGAIQICTNGGLAGANRCSGASLCSVDYIIIPGAGESPLGNPNVPGENYERFVSLDLKWYSDTYHSIRFCGLFLNSLGFPNVNAPIISCECPFEIDHVTGITALLGTVAAGVSNGAPEGFNLAFSQLAGNC